MKELSRETVRANMTVVTQNPYIFRMSVRDNLRLVKPDLTEDEMREVCRKACIDEDIESMPDKYDSLIGEGGVNLSGGQRQGWQSPVASSATARSCFSTKRLPPWTTRLRL